METKIAEFEVPETKEPIIVLYDDDTGGYTFVQDVGVPVNTYSVLTNSWALRAMADWLDGKIA